MPHSGYLGSTKYGPAYWAQPYTGLNPMDPMSQLAGYYPQFGAEPTAMDKTKQWMKDNQTGLVIAGLGALAAGLYVATRR